MKIALLGSGRTGAYLHEVIAPGDKITDFNSTNKASVSKLAEFDVVICFLPGDILNNYFDMLLKSKTPTIIGSTGYQFPDKIDEKIFQQNITWIWANNFSLGMQVAKNAIEALTIARKILPNAKTSIHEVHHTNKKDAPSGTAISWMQWYGDKNIKISSEHINNIINNNTSNHNRISITHLLAFSQHHVYQSINPITTAVRHDLCAHTVAYTWAFGIWITV